MIEKETMSNEKYLNPILKVVTDREGNAIYFSRAPIPAVRDGGDAAHYKHTGLYVYRREFLLAYPQLPIGPLEQAERLEQLRAIENGFKIRVAETDYESLGVDTPQDLERVARLFQIADDAQMANQGRWPSTSL